MSEHVGHVALFDDVRRLALDDGLLPDALERCLCEHHREGRFGTISSKNHRYMLPMAEDYDDATLADDESARRRMAYALGWAVHRAADRYFKPVYPHLDADENEPRMFHDLASFERRYVDDDGVREPFAPGFLQRGMDDHPASGAVPVERVESALGARTLADLLGLHVAVRRGAGRDRIEAAVDRVHHRYKDHARFEATDPAKVERFLAETAFYDPSDPLIDLADAVRDGDGTPRSLSAARGADNRSQYAQAVALGLDFLVAVADHYEHDRTREETTDRLRMWVGSPYDRPRRDADPAPPPDPLEVATVAAVEDAVRLYRYGTDLGDPLRDALARNPDRALSGIALDLENERVATSALEYVLGLYDGSEETNANANMDAEIGLALVAGALAGGAVTAATAGAAGTAPARDAAVIAGRGACDPAGADVDAVGDLLNSLWRRSVAGLHTLSPDLDVVEDWMDRLYAYDEADAAHRDAVAGALVEGASVPGFYDPDDDLVAYARAVQRGDVPDAGVDAALAGAECTYARAVAAGADRLEALAAGLDDEPGASDAGAVVPGLD
jgi:hypothetical protein